MNETKWIPADDLPEVEDTYIIAWLPKNTKRKECFYAIADFESDEWDLSSMKNMIDFWGEIEVWAWRELPEPYILED